MQKGRKGRPFLGKSTREFEKAAAECIACESRGDIARAKRALLRAVLHGEIAHRQIRDAAGSLLADVEDASRRMIHACLGTAFIDLPETFSEGALNAIVHGSLPMRAVQRLRSLFILRAGVWRQDVDSVRGLYELLGEYQRCTALGRDLEWKSLEAELWIHNEFERLASRVKALMGRE